MMTNGTKRQVHACGISFVVTNEKKKCTSQDVPLDATLAGPPPKPIQSKFKSSRTHVPSTTPSTSLGTSVLPSTSAPNALRSALRTGKLEDEQLVSIEDDSESEDDARAFMDALRRGDVKNAGTGADAAAASSNSDALIAALESAYGAPPPTPSAPAPAPARQYQQKDSKFKLVRAAAPPRTLAATNAEGPREGVPAMSETVLERKSVPQPPMVPMATAIIDSPSFPPPHATAVIDSPSFPPSQSRRPTRPPTVVPASGGAREVPGKKISRFKAQQQAN